MRRCDTRLLQYRWLPCQRWLRAAAKCWQLADACGRAHEAIATATAFAARKVADLSRALARNAAMVAEPWRAERDAADKVAAIDFAAVEVAHGQVFKRSSRNRNPLREKAGLLWRVLRAFLVSPEKTDTAFYHEVGYVFVGVLRCHALGHKGAQRVALENEWRNLQSAAGGDVASLLAERMLDDFLLEFCVRCASAGRVLDAATEAPHFLSLSIGGFGVLQRRLRSMPSQAAADVVQWMHSCGKLTSNKLHKQGFLFDLRDTNRVTIALFREESAEPAADTQQETGNSPAASERPNDDSATGNDSADTQAELTKLPMPRLDDRTLALVQRTNMILTDAWDSIERTKDLLGSKSG